MPQSAEWFAGLIDSHLSLTTQSNPSVFIAFKDENSIIHSFSVPRALIRHRMPNCDAIIAERSDGKKEANFVKDITLPALHIFIYWVYTGRLPDTAFEAELESANATAATPTPAPPGPPIVLPQNGDTPVLPTPRASPAIPITVLPQNGDTPARSPAQEQEQEQPSPIRPWLTAWLFGDRHNIETFQNLIFRRLDRLSFSAWTLADYFYVHKHPQTQRASRPGVLSPLCIGANFMLVERLSRSAISYEDYLACLQKTGSEGFVNALLLALVVAMMKSGGSGKEAWKLVVRGMRDSTRLFGEVVDDKVDEVVEEKEKRDAERWREAEEKGKGKMKEKGNGKGKGKGKQ